MKAQPSHAQLLREAAEAVAACEHRPMDEARRSFAETFTRVVQVRNALIAEARDPAAGSGVAARLPDANALLSLMASIEFPLGGFHGERFASTVRALRRLAQELEPTPQQDAGR